MPNYTVFPQICEVKTVSKTGNHALAQLVSYVITRYTPTSPHMERCIITADCGIFGCTQRPMWASSPARGMPLAGRLTNDNLWNLRIIRLRLQQRAFCPIRAILKLGNMQSIPSISALSAESKIPRCQLLPNEAEFPILFVFLHFLHPEQGAPGDGWTVRADVPLSPITHPRFEKRTAPCQADRGGSNAFGDFHTV